MRIEEREIDVGQLEFGMYVCRLDRPWTDTRFPLQGFVLENEAQRRYLAAHCRKVWIDVQLGRAPSDAPLRTLDRRNLDRQLHSTRYEDQVPVEVEAPAAREALDLASRAAARLIDQLRDGHLLSSDDVKEAATAIVSSVLRNADALFWVNALRRHDSYTYSHAINCSILSAAFGRHLGLPQPLLLELARGGLLFDVGKARLPADLLDDPGALSPARMAEARTHLQHGLDIVAEIEEHSDAVRDMVHAHHERFDGSGYPRRLVGHSIPLYARMAGIVDSFDAMTSARPHAPTPKPHHEALQELYRHRDTLYHGELVEQFIGALGVYPTGSLVELSTGEVGVVMAQNTSRRLRPRVMLLTGADKRTREHFESLDLMQQPATPGAVEILRPLPTGAFGLDPTELYL